MKLKRYIIAQDASAGMIFYAEVIKATAKTVTARPAGSFVVLTERRVKISDVLATVDDADQALALLSKITVAHQAARDKMLAVTRQLQNEHQRLQAELEEKLLPLKKSVEAELVQLGIERDGIATKICAPHAIYEEQPALAA